MYETSNVLFQMPLPKWGSVELKADTPAYLEVVISGRKAGGWRSRE